MSDLLLQLVEMIIHSAIDNGKGLHSRILQAKSCLPSMTGTCPHLVIEGGVSEKRMKRQIAQYPSTRR